MLMTDIRRVIEQVSRDKGIDRQVLISTLEEAMKSAAKKKFGSRIDIEARYNDESGEIELYQFREVAEIVTDHALQMTIEDGRKLDSDCEIGDSLGTKMDTSSFGRIAAQSAKQVIIQKMKDAERNAVYNSFIERKGEIVNGIILRIHKGDIIVNLGTAEGVLPLSEQVPKETFQRGDRVRAYVMDVRQETREPQVILSRAHAGFLIQLFKTEVPEISESIVNIMGAVREPGSRAKIAVSSSDSDIDPVGACVGMKGSRVQNVVQELKGEKIDIIPWHVDIAKYVCNALAPAQISRVIIDDEGHSMEVIVPDEFLSIAIGKKGQNVRLASKLTGWHLDVKSEAAYSKRMRNGYDSLMKLDGMTIVLADILYEKGFYSAEELANASVEDLAQLRDMTTENAQKLIQSSQFLLKNKQEALSSGQDKANADGNTVPDTRNKPQKRDIIIHRKPDKRKLDHIRHRHDINKKHSDNEDNLETDDSETDERENGERENGERENGELENGELENDELENDEIETDETENDDDIENSEDSDDADDSDVNDSDDSDADDK